MNLEYRGEGNNNSEKISKLTDDLQDLEKSLVEYKLNGLSSIEAPIIPASTEKKILGSTALVGEDAKEFVRERKKLSRLVNPTWLDEKIGGKESGVSIAVWNNIIFYLPSKDLSETTQQEAQDFALQALNDIARTEVGSFILQKLQKKFTDNKFLPVKMRAGIPSGTKELYTTQKDDVVNGHIENVEKNNGLSSVRFRKGAGGGVNNGRSHIHWPFQYARYHYNSNEPYNKNGGSPVAASPSECLFHEFCHCFDDYRLVDEYLQIAKSRGITIDANVDGIADIDQGKLPMNQAGHVGGMLGDLEFSTYFEKLFALEKKSKGYSDHDPRPNYGKKFSLSKLKRVGVRVNNASIIR